MSVRHRYLLDTNVLSETRKKRPDEKVLAFLSKAAPSSLFVSSLTIGELKKGIALKRKQDALAAEALEAWVAGLETLFSAHILGIDVAVAKLWGEWSAERSRPVIDTLLAATAVANDLLLVTRNEADVAGLPVRVINPWRSR